MAARHRGWIAKLSNGETVIESPPVPGEKTSWHKLITRLDEEGLTIRSLSLQHIINGSKIRVHAIPHCVAYMAAFESKANLMTGEQRKLQGIGSVIEDRVYITWVDLTDGSITQDIRNMNDHYVHTTMRDRYDTTTGMRDMRRP